MREKHNFKRHRRMRASKAIRHLIRETKLSSDDFIYPMFVTEGENIKQEVPSMQGILKVYLDHLREDIKEVNELGIQAVMLFGIPAAKDDMGTEAYADEGIIQRAIRLIKKQFPELLVIADTCLCEYTSHGHCG